MLLQKAEIVLIELLALPGPVIPACLMPSKANIRMKRKRRKSRERMERMELSRDITKFLRDDQYLRNITNIISDTKYLELTW